MSAKLKELRHAAAASGTGCISVSIEDLNIIHSDIMELKKSLSEAAGLFMECRITSQKTILGRTIPFTKHQLNTFPWLKKYV